MGRTAQGRLALARTLSSILIPGYARLSKMQALRALNYLPEPGKA
jgi:hypothetical protein